MISFPHSDEVVDVNITQNLMRVFCLLKHHHQSVLLPKLGCLNLSIHSNYCT